MKINRKVRLKNKYFWLSMIPALLLLIRQILEIFGLAVDLSMLQEQLVSVIGTVFSILALIGVVVDHYYSQHPLEYAGIQQEEAGPPVCKKG